MRFIIQIALTFFLIQFLVVLTIMVVAVLVANSEEAITGREFGVGALSRTITSVARLPGRAYLFAKHLVCSVLTEFFPPVYHFPKVRRTVTLPPATRGEIRRTVRAPSRPAIAPPIIPVAKASAPAERPHIQP